MHRALGWGITKGTLENAALRRQLTIYQGNQKHPRLRVGDRAFGVVLRRFWRGWEHALIIQRISANQDAGLVRLVFRVPVTIRQATVRPISDANARGARNPTAGPLALPAHARGCRNNVHQRWEWQDQCRTELPRSRARPPAGGRTDTRHARAGRRARVYGGESGNRTSREVSVKVQRYGVTDIIVASP